VRERERRGVGACKGFACIACIACIACMQASTGPLTLLFVVGGMVLVGVEVMLALCGVGFAVGVGLAGFAVGVGCGVCGRCGVGRLRRGLFAAVCHLSKGFKGIGNARQSMAYALRHLAAVPAPRAVLSPSSDTLTYLGRIRLRG
jgi:hypothetical protein